MCKACEPNNHPAPPAIEPDASPHGVMRLRDVAQVDITTLLGEFGIELQICGEAPLPGSYWGEDEAGLIGHRLYVRSSTPIHSLLHEACHFICMDDRRRRSLHTDAGGDDLEECAVCYLQILLADRIPGVGRERMMADMDRWGYTFRLGSARRWFTEDADDARTWLTLAGLLWGEGPSSA